MTAAGCFQHYTATRSLQSRCGSEKPDRVEDVLDDLAGNDDIEARIREFHVQEHLVMNFKPQAACVFGLAVARLHAGNACKAGHPGATQKVSRATANFKQAISGNETPEFSCSPTETPRSRGFAQVTVGLAGGDGPFVSIQNFKFFYIRHRARVKQCAVGATKNLVLATIRIPITGTLANRTLLNY